MALLMGGASSAFAETKVVYGRAVTADEKNGYEAWSANDVSKSGTNVWIGHFNYDEKYGLYASGKGNRESVLSFDHTNNAKQTITLEFNTFDNTGSNKTGESNYSYIKIGNAIEIQSNQQNQTGCVIVNGEKKVINNCNLKNYNRYNDIWTITAVINSASKTLESLTLRGLTMNGKTASLDITEEINLGSSASFNSITIGFIRKALTPSAAIKSIKITEEEQTVSTADYTVNYKFGDSIIKTVSGTTVIGNNVDAESPITVDGQLYYFADGAVTSLTVGASENILNVEMRKAYEYNYSVTDNFGNNIAEGTSTEGETVYGQFAKYVNINSVLYEAPQGNAGYYKYSFIPNAQNYIHNIEYKESEIKNIAYYSEAENISGMTSVAGYNADIRCSGGKGAYCNETVTATTLQPGKYKASVLVWGNKGATITVNAGDKNLLATETQGYLYPETSKEFEITEATPITIQGGANGKVLDYIYIEKTAETITLNTATDYTYSTFCSDYDLDFSSVNDVEVYKVAILGDKVVTTKIEDGKVKAGTGIIIKNVNHVASVTVPVTSNVADLTGNDLKAATTDVPSDGAKYFALTKLSDGKVGFALVAKDVVIPAGKAYLEVANGTAGPAAKFFGLDGEATGINSVKTAKADGAYYTLEGVKTTKPVKGLYIHNGKKIIVK